MSSSTQALVIGNGAYPEGLTLASPSRDAEAIKETLDDLGIDVNYVVDQPYSESLVIIEEFIQGVNKEAVTASVLYYSGHGLQLNDTNYIVPIDFQDPTGNGVTRLISVQSIVDRMTNATAVRIVLLDACRTGKNAKTILGTKGIEVDKTFTYNDALVPSEEWQRSRPPMILS